MQLTYAMLTNVGSRSVNEDSARAQIVGDKACFVVCDGLGGHGMGDIASSLVADVFMQNFNETIDAGTFLEDVFPVAQDALIEEQKRRGAQKKMKTTAVVLVSDEKYAYIGHVGYSRGYYFRRGRYKSRTKDHSIPQMLVLSREIKESEIRNHPDRNIVLRVMGVEWEDPQYELEKPIPLINKQAFLLCSDGFWELIEEKQMCQLLKKAKNVQEWLDGMKNIVINNGVGREMDNFTAVAVWCSK